MRRWTIPMLMALAGTVALADGDAAAPALAFTMKNIDGQDVNLTEQYAGKVVLVVNVASKCGFTPQYKGLEALYKQYEKQGFVILGFPCNQFRQQEPGDADTIKKFCHDRYGVTFDLFAKINVNGDDAAPLYKYLKSTDDGGDVKWNFEKFLIGRDGKVVQRYRSKVKPEQLKATLETELTKKVDEK